jgi:hypothetical protein
MKKLTFLLLALALLFSCAHSGTVTKPGLPAKASVSGAKGIFIQGSGAKAFVVRASAIGSKALVTATDATLGEITSSSQPQMVTFLDDQGNSVAVTVSQAMQLNATYMLMTYSSTSGSGTGVLNLSSGALANISVIPDNWPMIWTQGTLMYFESGGSIYATNLDSGAASALSASANVYNMNAEIGLPGVLNGTAPWGSMTWIFVDGSGNVYALYSASSASNQAVCIPATGSAIDFGSNYATYTFYDSLPIGTIVWGGWVALDSGNLYLIKDAPYGSGNQASVYPVTFNPAASGVISIASTPISQATGMNWTGGMSMIGAGIAAADNVWSNGPDTWKFSGGIITYYDTSAVPVSNLVNGNPETNSVTNWQYSGGAIYAGPTASQSSINLVQFETTPTVSDPPLVIDAGITSWAVVGGVLFYTDGSGTHQATVNTQTDTLGPVTAYAGGPVIAITQ